jgi:hypothetical protein
MAKIPNLNRQGKDIVREVLRGWRENEKRRHPLQSPRNTAVRQNIACSVPQGLDYPMNK